MHETTLLRPGLSPVSGKAVEAASDRGSLSSDSDVMVLREVEWWLAIVDDRGPGRVRHSVADIIRFAF